MMMNIFKKENFMYENFNKLNTEFLKIKKLKWIQGITNGYGNAGRTFEYLLGKKEADELPVPDYYGIEIKTRAYNSKYKLSLFSTVPDGPELFETKRILQKYGYPARGMKSANVLFGYINAKKESFIGKKYQYKLDVDKKEKKIFLNIYDINNKLIERKSYWSFELLKEKLELKLQNLAIIKWKGRIINEKNYFYYQEIIFYQLKSFERFIELIEQGIITIVIKIDVYRDEKKMGQIHDHGTSFQIAEEHLALLFNTIYI